MPFRERPRLEPTENWSPLQLQLVWPEQVTDELIRPVVWFGRSPAERAKQTGIPERAMPSAPTSWPGSATRASGLGRALLP